MDASAIFDNGGMRVDNNPVSGDYDVQVIFSDKAALLKFLFSQEQDILDLLLGNKIQVEGNINYIYRFVYLTIDLKNRLTCRPHS